MILLGFLWLRFTVQSEAGMAPKLQCCLLNSTGTTTMVNPGNVCYSIA